MFESDARQICELWNYLQDVDANHGLAVEELLWVIGLIRENPTIDLLKALELARMEWSLK